METEQAVAASSADADAGGSGLKSWERVWSLDELKASSMGGRSLASDLGLLNFLKDFSGQLREQTKLLENQVTELVQSADSAKIRLHNTFNHFLQLSHTQYMENRVYDEDVANISREGDAAGSTAGASSSSSSNSSSTGGENRPRTHEELEALLMPKYTEAIQLGVTALLNAPTFVELDDFGLMAQAAASSSTADLSLSGVDGSSANNNTNANKASVRYDWETPLPHVIGTREFQEEEFCGLWVPPPEPEPEDQQLDDLSADHFSEEDYESDGPLHNQDGDLIPDLPAGASPTTEALLAPPVLPKKNAIKAQEDDDDDDDDDDEAESRSDDGEEEEEEDVSEEEDEESEVSEDEEESGDDEWDDQPKVKKSRKTRKGKKQVAAAVPKAPMSFQEQLAASLVGQMRGEGAPLPSMIKKSGSTKKTKKTTGTRGKQPDNSTTSGDAAGKAEEGRKQGEGDDEDDAAEQEAAAAPIKAKTGLSLFDSLSVADDDDLDAMLLGASTASKAKAPVSKTSAATTTGSAAAGQPKSAFSLDDLDLDLDDPDALFVVPVVGAKKPQTTSTAAAPKSQAGGANKLSLLDSLSLGGDDDLDDGQALFAPAVPKPAAKTAAPPAVAKKPMAATAEPATAAKKGPSSLMDFSLDDDLDDGFLSTVSIPKKTAATPTSSAPPSKTNSGALSFDLDGDDDGELFSLAAAAKPSTAAAKPAAPASKTTTKPAAPAGLFDFGDGLDEDDGEFGFSLGSAAKKPAAPTPTAAAPKPASPAPATTKSNANSLLSPFGPDDDGEDELFSLGGAAAAKPATPTPAAKPATPTPTAAAPKPASATTKSNVNSLLSPFGPDDDGEDELFSLGSAAAAKPATPTPAAKQTTPARVQSPAPTTATDDLFDFPSPATRTAASPAPPKPAAAAPTTTATAPDDLFDFPSPAAAPKPAEAAPPAANKQLASRKSTGPSDLFDEDGGDMFDFPSIGSKPAAQQQQTKTVQFQDPEPPKQPSSQEQPTRARAGSRIAELQGKLDLNVGTLLPGSAPIKPHVDTSSFDLSEESTPTARSSTNSNNSSPARPLQHLTKDRAQTAKKRPPTRGKRAPTSRTTQTTTTTPTPAVKTTATAATTTAPPDLFELPDFVPVKTAAPAAAATRGGPPAMAKGADVLGALDGFDSFFDAPTGKTEEQLRVAEAAKYSHPTAQKERIKAAQVEQTRQAALARMEQDKARVQEEQRAAAAARAQKQREEEEEKQRLDAQKRAEDERRAAAAPKPTTTTTKADDGGFDLDDLLAPVVLQKKPRSVDVDDIFAMPAPAPAATKTAGPDIFSSPSPAAAKPASRPAFVFDDSGDLFADPLAEKKKPARSFDIDSFFS